LELKAFLKEVQEGTKDIIEQGKLPDIMRVNKCNSDIEFYSQKFYPEMITELFEGWIFDEELDCYTNFNDTIEFCVSLNKDDDCYQTYKLNDDKWLHIPSCLGIFITDCQRANIELIWSDLLIN
jgi:hypothetical protein